MKSMEWDPLEDHSAKSNTFKYSNSPDPPESEHLARLTWQWWCVPEAECEALQRSDRVQVYAAQEE